MDESLILVYNNDILLEGIHLDRQPLPKTRIHELQPQGRSGHAACGGVLAETGHQRVAAQLFKYDKQK